MSDWLTHHAPAWLAEPLNRVLTPWVLGWLSFFSVLAFVASLIVIPWLVARLPADYFSAKRDSAPPSVVRSERFGPALRIAANLFGALLLLAGVAMLVLPGQGVITIVVALGFLRFPGKRRFQRWLLARRGVSRVLDALRRRAGREPFRLD